MSAGADNSRAITMVAAILGGLVAAVMLGRYVAQGDYQKVAVLTSATFVILFVLLIGNRYWYLIPVTVSLSLPTFQLGGRNIDLAELAIAMSTGLFIVRFASKREHLQIFRLRNAPILLYFAWVMLVWALNPVGLAGFGSMTGGGRFYATVLMALAAFLIISNQEIEERDIKWIFGLMLTGLLLDLARNLLEYLVLGRQLGVAGLDIENEGTYTWHQVMAGPVLLLISLLFCRYSPAQVFSIAHPGRFALYLIGFIPVALSGKRAAMMQLFLFPLLSAILYRQYRYVVLFAMMVALGLGGILVGQGNLFHLPLNAQRALSWLPGNWDPELSSLAGGQDEFRKALREIAIEEIRRDPWIGDGFSVDIGAAAGAYYHAMMFGAPDIRDQVMPFAIGKAWHNTWLGYAADFGIPLSIIQVFVLFTGIFCSYTLFRRAEGFVWVRTMALYCFMFFVRDLLLSWTSGHSATDAFTRWWMYGMVFALTDQVARWKRENKVALSNEKAAPEAEAAEFNHS